MSCIEDGCENIIILSVDRHLRFSLAHSNLATIPSLDSIPRDVIADSLNKLGEESAKAQKLQVPITTTSKFSDNFCHDLIFLILKVVGSLSDSKNIRELGFIRFGPRDLYVAGGSSLRYLPNCPSILDFYIRPKRRGYGKMLLDIVLEQIKAKPQSLAYDRPSESMISFLRKHYALDKPLWQHNHFVIFDGIFALL